LSTGKECRYLISALDTCHGVQISDICTLSQKLTESEMNFFTQMNFFTLCKLFYYFM